ncbi:MAG: proliferating cell nuclear antigen (pcna) [Candidatus Aenigmatarchaeota archaeon]|nr:MAG: proliferating cell nuclear antigen (pcna) [Candidatus Aenigmarchaeota archaeon]
MFKITLSDTELLKNTIPIIAEIIDEGVFTIDKNGMSLLCPDRTMVSVVDFKLPASAFEKFEVDSTTTIGLNLSRFASILKRIKGGEKITLEPSEDNSRLRVVVEGDSKRVFEIPLLDVKMESPPIDQLKFKGRVEVSSNLLEDGISDAEIVGDSVVFEADPECFRIYSKGDVTSTELEVKGNNGVKIDTSEKIRARYPLEYLKKMIKVGKLSKQAVIEFGTDYPMRMEFTLPDKLQLRFILAPRIEE